MKKLIVHQMHVLLFLSVFMMASLVRAQQYFPVRDRMDVTSLDGTWQLHRDDIRFYGNRADVDLMAFLSPQASLALCSDTKNIHIENVDGRIVLTDNLVVGTYGTKFTPPAGVDANKLGQRKGRITLKSFLQDKSNTAELLERIFGSRRDVNPEQPYMQSYGK